MNQIKEHQPVTVTHEEVIDEIFSKQTMSSAGSLAVCDRYQKMTYEELQNHASSIAKIVLDNKVSSKRPVAILMKKSCQQVAAIMGVLQCGFIYAPIDPVYPYQRMSYVLEELGTELIIADTEYAEIAAQLAEGKCVLHIVADIPERKSSLLLQPEKRRKRENKANAESPACIIFTSGSTGTPKGVIHTHKSILHLARQHIRDLKITGKDRVSLLGSICHVSGMTDLFRGLLCGASVYLYDFNRENTTDFATWMYQHKISVYHSVPTVFRYLVKSLKEKEQVASLRIVHLGGERLVRSDFESFKDFFPENCILMNNLGCSELSSFRNFPMTMKSRIENDLIPAGYGVEGKEVCIVNDRLEEVGIGEVGEILLKSEFLAEGYWNRDELNNTSFLKPQSGSRKRGYRTGDLGFLDVNGCLHHLGRKDNQLKIRGHRIELSEIEECLKKVKGVDFAVVKPDDKSQEVHLDAFVVLSEKVRKYDYVIDKNYLSKHCKKYLPSYMLPVNYVFLDQLPLSTSGKILYSNLEVPKDYGDDFDASRTETESMLAVIWTKILNRSPIGKKDNFFEIGGHSLAALELIGEIEKQFSLTLDFASIYETPTLGKMAEKLEKGGYGLNRIVHKISGEASAKKNIFMVHTLGGETIGYAKFANRLKEQFIVYGILSPRLFSDHVKNQNSVETIAACYIEQMKQIQPEGPYIIGGACFGTMVAHEMGLQLTEKGENVQFVVMIDPTPDHYFRKYSKFEMMKNCFRLFVGSKVSPRFIQCLHPVIRKILFSSLASDAHDHGLRTHLLRRHMHCRRKYRRRQTANKTVIFWSEQSEKKTPLIHNPRVGWIEYIKEAKCYVFNCHHLELLRGKGDEIADKVAEYFNEMERRNTV